MPKSKNNRDKKYNPNKYSKKKINQEEESYTYTLPNFVKGCGQMLLAFFGTVIVFVCIGLIFN